jgi:hypothetical protein
MFLGSKLWPVRRADNLASHTHPLHFTPQKHYFYVSGTHEAE